MLFYKIIIFNKPTIDGHALILKQNIFNSVQIFLTYKRPMREGTLVENLVYYIGKPYLLLPPF